jgi:methyl-accepting chemotaxis protein
MFLENHRCILCQRVILCKKNVRNPTACKYYPKNTDKPFTGKNREGDIMKWFTNLKISKKLILGFLIVSVLGFIIGLVGILGILKITDNENKLYNTNTKAAISIGNAQQAFLSLNVNIRDLFINSEKDRSAYYDSISENLGLVQAELVNYGAVVPEGKDRTDFDQLTTQFAQYKMSVDTIVKMSQTDASVGSLRSLLAMAATFGANTAEAFRTVAADNAALATENLKNDAAYSAMSIGIMCGIVVISIVIAISLGVSMSRMIGRPLLKMAEDSGKLAVGDISFAEGHSGARKDEIGSLASAFKRVVDSTKVQAAATQRVADGDLTVVIDVRSEKDVLGISLSGLVENLNQLVLSIVTSAEQVASGADLVSNSSMALSQGATEQASSVQELSASIEEIASQTRRNAQNAKTASEFATNAQTGASAGRERMKEMVRAMDEINTSAASISKIIKVIDDIAFQTNILALNAAVEAARAGQHGKGFAVVAEEVRTLAAKSAQAAKETAALIEGSIRKTEAGTKIADETSVALDRIVEEVAKAANLVEEIAVASNDQAAGIQMLNNGIAQVSSVVQNNAATSEESAAASEQLTGQASALKEAVSVFKLNSSYFGDSKPAKALGSGLRAVPAVKPARQKIALGDGDFGKY